MSDSINVVPLDVVLRKKLEVVGIANRCGTQAAVIKTGISARTIRHWKSLFKLLGIDGLRNKSRAPKRVHNKKDQGGVLKAALIRLHKEEPGLTRLQIKVLLCAEPTDETVSQSWIAKQRKLLGLTRKTKVKMKVHKKRYEIPSPGYLQIDTKEVPKESLVNPEDKLYQFTAIDECTRVRFLMGSSTKSKFAATKFLKQAVDFYNQLGVTVLRVQTDRGTEFTLPQTEVTLRSYAQGTTDDALFTRTCNELGIKHRLIKPRSPELNGKVERSHKTDGDRFYAKYAFKNDRELDHALKNIWLAEYNEKRPHSSLSYKTPIEFLKQKLNENTSPVDTKVAA